MFVAALILFICQVGMDAIGEDMVLKEDMPQQESEGIFAHSKFKAKNPC